MVIRRGIASDADRIWQVRTRAIRESCRSDYREAEIEAWASQPKPAGLEALIEDTDFLVAVVEGRVVGHAFLDRNLCEIAAVFVCPDHARSGIGSALMRSLEQTAREAGLAHLRLSATLNAVDFYEALGYASIKRSTYQHPSGLELACVLMQKKL